MPRAATLRVRRDSSREVHRSAPKRGLKAIQALPYRPNGQAHLNGRPSRIQPPDEIAIRQAITLVQGKWRISILCNLQDGPVRVGELKRRMPPISKKVLNQHLRRMEEDGLLVRTELRGKTPHVEYALTDLLGRSVLRLLQSVVKWATSAAE